MGLLLNQLVHCNTFLYTFVTVYNNTPLHSTLRDRKIFRYNGNLVVSIFFVTEFYFILQNTDLNSWTERNCSMKQLTLTLFSLTKRTSKFIVSPKKDQTVRKSYCFF